MKTILLKPFAIITEVQQVCAKTEPKFLAPVTKYLSLRFSLGYTTTRKSRLQPKIGNANRLGGQSKIGEILKVGEAEDQTPNSANTFLPPSLPAPTLILSPSTKA